MDGSRSRLDVLSRQLCKGDVAPSAPSVCPKEMQAWLVHDNAELRAAIFDFLKDPIYKYNGYLSLLEFREQTLQRLQKFIGARFFSVRDYLDDPRKFMAALECLSYCDYSLGIKAGVVFTLCGGTICKLGTRKHHETLLPRIDTLDLVGSFSMTELGHGSNVAGIETTAHYDPATQEFVINTPNNAAAKAWIGGTGQHGKLTVVFAQLFTRGKYEGVHAFAVRIRDDHLNPLPCIRIKDMGPKQGLNGVDNGMLWFDHLRVPRDALLDAYGSVAPDGTYTSPIASISQRFGVTVGGLTTGRVLIAQGGVDGQKIGLAIAIKYAAQRPQFGDKTVLSYLTHQSRLFPPLANTYALQLAQKHIKELVARKQASDAKTIHVLSSGVKAAATWSRVAALQDCRECCGGMGFLAVNKIGPLCNDMNVDVTFEGDNTVMMQQVARACLEDKSLTSAPSWRPSTALSSLPPGPVSSSVAAELLRYRLHVLTARLAREMGAAAASGGAKAASASFDANLDTAVAIGWAFVEHFCAVNFAQQVQAAPAALVPGLSVLCGLYGMTRLDKDRAFFLEAGVMSPSDVGSLRERVHGVYGQLAADNGRLAIQLVDAFGIPDHLLQAPIAIGDWRSFGQE